MKAQAEQRARTEEPRDAESQWFWDHYRGAVEDIRDFCEPAGVSLTDISIADIGCGDGIMALGMARHLRPRKLVGFDVVATNTGALSTRSAREGAGDTLPSELEFRTSEPARTPAADGEFDFVYSWSAFEHISDPLAVLREARRILRPTGHFFLQLWPFYHSARGSHLWDWFDDDFHHLIDEDDAIIEQLRASDRHSAEWTAYMSREFAHLNRVTVEQLQRSVLAAGFEVRKLELLTNPVTLTPELARYSWADLGVGGIKLIALPRP